MPTGSATGYTYPLGATSTPQHATYRRAYYLIKPEFERRGIKLGRDSFFNYLRAQKLLVRPVKNYTRTTDSKHCLRKYPNVLPGQCLSRPEQVFVSDITYLKSK